MNVDAILPLLIWWLLLSAGIKRLPVFDLFVAGAKKGMSVAISVLPNLAGMLVAVSLMNASGLMDWLITALAPLVEGMGLPKEVAPLLILRPLSGSASLAMVENLLTTYGADTRIGMIASTLMGSSETIFYTICVYLSQVKDRSTGYAIPCALIGALAGAWLCGLLF